MKIGVLRAELLHTDRRGGPDMNLIAAFRSFANAPKKTNLHVHWQLQREAGGATLRRSYFPEAIQEIVLLFKKSLAPFFGYRPYIQI